MIKFFGLIPRLEGQPPQEFHDHWRHPHGTLALPIETFRGYVQGHQFPHPALGSATSQFEGFAEVWFHDLDDAVGLATHPQYVAYVQPDELNFVDLSRLKWLNTTEDVVIAEPGGGHDGHPGDLAWDHKVAHTSIKLLQFLTDADSMTREQFHDAALEAGALRAVRCSGVTADPAEAPAYTSVRELWWATLTAFDAATAARPEGLRRLLETAPGAETALMTAERFI